MVMTDTLDFLRRELSGGHHMCNASCEFFIYALAQFEEALIYLYFPEYFVTHTHKKKKSCCMWLNDACASIVCSCVL